MNNDSIFSRSRFEYDGNHLYFLDTNRVEQLESNTPVIIYGSRGTGKTTLLNALNWEEQHQNVSLINALNGNKFNREYLGVYVKLPKVNIEAISCYQDDNELLYSKLFSFYIDLVWLEQLTLAITTLASENAISVSAKEEKNAIRKILERYTESLQPWLCSVDNGLNDLSIVFRQMREDIETAAFHKESINLLFKRLPLTGQVGDFGRQVSSFLHDIWIQKGRSEYKFKICFDECECLDDFQVRILSTLVRLSNHPTFFVYSFISLPKDFYTTLIPNLFIAKADVQHIALDEMSDKEFAGLSAGVIRVRMKAENISSREEYSDKTIFGDLSINTNIEKILNRSETKEAYDFVLKTQNEMQHPYFQQYKKDQHPYYQVYLVSKLGLDIQKCLDENWSKAQRSQESREIRKKMVAAYLSICNEFKTRPIYSGAEVIFQVSDKSIRDYLWQLHEIYNEFGKPINDFLTSTIPVEIQDRAIKHASENKLKSLPSSPLSEPGKVYRLVFGLGRLTALIQSKSADNSHLRTPERGIFSVIHGASEEETKLVQHVIEAAEAGFLKIKSKNQNEIKFRVHTSLAAHFGFSYRGAYADVPITLNHLLMLRDAGGNEDLNEKVSTIAQTIYNIEDNQLSIEGI